jgi:hypothetical protein
MKAGSISPIWRLATACFMVFQLASIGEAQTYSSTDVVGVINSNAGFLTSKRFAPNYQWTDYTYSAAISGSFITITETSSNIEQNLTSGASCLLNSSLKTVSTFDARTMKPTVDINPNPSGTDSSVKVFAAVLHVQNNQRLVRSTFETTHHTCPQPGVPPDDAFLPASKVDNDTVIVWFSSQDAATRFKEVVASAWGAP